MAVLPTPGSPMSTGLFLVRRDSTWMTRRISSSRPMTGSSLPLRAASVRSRPYLSSAWNVSRGLACDPVAAAHRAQRGQQLVLGDADLVGQRQQQVLDGEVVVAEVVPVLVGGLQHGPRVPTTRAPSHPRRGAGATAARAPCRPARPGPRPPGSATGGSWSPSVAAGHRAGGPASAPGGSTRRRAPSPRRRRPSCCSSNVRGLSALARSSYLVHVSSPPRSSPVRCGRLAHRHQVASVLAMGGLRRPRAPAPDVGQLGPQPGQLRLELEDPPDPFEVQPGRRSGPGCAAAGRCPARV